MGRYIYENINIWEYINIYIYMGINIYIYMGKIYKYINIWDKI